MQIYIIKLIINSQTCEMIFAYIICLLMAYIFLILHHQNVIIHDSSINDHYNVFQVMNNYLNFYQNFHKFDLFTTLINF